ncbi:hypothetical protein [Streptomyces sp. NPDC058595]|uniref:hypothetical protein n=1 Tax=Streptomyces sp. NPDC058595 TaxID=3346550 RepID=UPI00366114BD
MQPLTRVVRIPAQPSPRTDTDVRALELDGWQLTSEQRDRLHGNACARCGGRSGLRPAGYAYVLMRGSRHGYGVSVCGGCPTWGAW